MDASQKKFLASLLLMGAFSALLFQCVIKPIRQRAESEPERQLESARQAREAAHSRLLARADEILLAREKWRSDVIKAGGTGPGSSIPPLIALRRNDAGEFMVTNIAGEPICLRMWRTRQAERCELGLRNRCVVISPGETMEFAAPNAQGACRGQGFEFRIGNEVTTDLPWWSASALDDFDRATSLIRESSPLDYEALRREIEVAAAYLADEGVAERWKRVIEPLRQIQLDSMTSKEGAAESELAPP